MCGSSLAKEKRPMKDRVSQRGCQGSALPASCTGGRSGGCWHRELTLHTRLVGTKVCRGNCRKSFILENVLWDSRAALCYCSEHWQKCLLGEYTACGCYFWNSQKPLRKKPLPAALWAVILHPFVHWETSWGKACRHLQGGRNEHFWLFK